MIDDPSMIHLLIRQMQAAYSAGLRDGPEACMTWLGNALRGPGNVPPPGSDPDWYARDAWEKGPMPEHCATICEPAIEAAASGEKVDASPATDSASRGPLTKREVVRGFFIANFLDGREVGLVRINGTDLANAIADLFSSDAWDERIVAAIREQHERLIQAE